MSLYNNIILFDHDEDFITEAKIKFSEYNIICLSGDVRDIINENENIDTLISPANC